MEPLPQDDDPVRERGPHRTLAVERSFPPLPSEAAAAGALAPLAQQLLARAAQVRRGKVCPLTRLPGRRL